MSNPSAVFLQLPAAVTNGIALSQTPAAAGALTLNGSLVTGGVANLATAQRVGVADSGSSDGAVVFTLVGTNRSGAPISETITGLASNTLHTNQDFLTLTSITASAATVGAITVGTVGIGSTEWVLDNFFASSWALAVAVHIVSGALTYTVEHTYDDINAGISPGSATGYTAAANLAVETPSNVPPLAWPNSVLYNKTADGEAQYVSQPIFAHRLTVTIGTGKAMMQSIQAGIGSSP